MSSQSIINFQKSLYNSLDADSQIKNIVSKIYIGPTYTTTPPFITLSIENISSFCTRSGIYDIAFSIEIYFQDKNYNMPISLAAMIEDNFSKIDYQLSNCSIISLKAVKTSFQEAKNLVMNKMNISYQASIIEEIA